MKYLLFTILLTTAFITEAQNKLITYVSIDSMDIAELQQRAIDLGVPSFFLEFNYAVDIYKLQYHTVDPSGNPTIASGALAIPRAVTCELPLGSYQHGTIADKDDVPSRYSAEMDIGLIYATEGYYVAMPDYLGLGDSPGLHPYIHAASEATAVVDMLYASRELLDELEKAYNDQLFLFGYSQGGHATAAAHQLIQDSFAPDWTVTASNPMSGPYDVSGVQAEVITSNVPYPTPSYLPYVLFAYQSVYGNLFDDPSEVFKAPYDQLLPPLFDGTHSTGEIDAIMPSIPNQILNPVVLDSFRNDPNHRFREALRQNDLYDWKPEAPIRLTYCTGDDQVSYLNSIKAYDTFVANGATDIEIADLGPLDHFGCGEPALIGGRFWFKQFKESKNGLTVTETTSTPESAVGANDGQISIVVTGGHGALSYLWSNGSIGTQISGLASGVYSVTITDETGCRIVENVEVGILVDAHDLQQQDVQMKIFPNPTDGLLTVELKNVASPLLLELRDINSRLLVSQSVANGRRQIDLGQLSAGIYVLRIMGEGVFESRKVVVY